MLQAGRHFVSGWFMIVKVPMQVVLGHELITELFYVTSRIPVPSLVNPNQEFMCRNVLHTCMLMNVVLHKC